MNVRCARGVSDGCQEGVRWCQMCVRWVLDSVRWVSDECLMGVRLVSDRCQMVSDGCQMDVRWCLMVSDGVRWFQMRV